MFFPDNNDKSGHYIQDLSSLRMYIIFLLSCSGGDACNCVLTVTKITLDVVVETLATVC